MSIFLFLALFQYFDFTFGKEILPGMKVCYPVLTIDWAYPPKRSEDENEIVDKFWRKISKNKGSDSIIKISFLEDEGGDYGRMRVRLKYLFQLKDDKVHLESMLDNIPEDIKSDYCILLKRGSFRSYEDAISSQDLDFIKKIQHYGEKISENKYQIIQNYFKKFSLIDLYMSRDYIVYLYKLS